MSGQDTSAIDQAAGVLAEIAQAEAVEGYRDAQVTRMRTALQLAACAAYSGTVATLAREVFEHVGLGMPHEPLTVALLAADAEAIRLLGLLGVDLDATKGGDRA